MVEAESPAAPISFRRGAQIDGGRCLVRIQVLGSGCKKCNDLYAEAQQAAQTLGPGVSVEKVDDVDVFFRLGVTRTPVLALDDELLSSGVVLDASQIVELLRSRGA